MGNEEWDEEWGMRNDESGNRCLVTPRYKTG
jgi:hypothetical protein